MDGTFAVLTLVFGMYDAFNDCPQDCLAPHQAAPRIAVSQGVLQFQGNNIGDEVFVRYDTAHANGPYQMVFGASYSSLGDVWAGVGHAYKMSAGDTGLYAELHAMTGLYQNDGGPDLGGPIEFRSGVELGWESESGWRIAASYDHRSNAELYASNPGVETVQLRVSRALN